MSKGGSSTTERTIPAWLENALKPLLAGSTQALGNFQGQGQNILQGLDYNQGMPTMKAGDDRSFQQLLRDYYMKTPPGKTPSGLGVDNTPRTGSAGGTT